MEKKPTLGYWNMRGYAQAARFLLKYLKVDYEEKLYNFSPAPDFKKDFRQNHRPNLDVEFSNLPYWIDGDVKMTESIPILREIARKHGPHLFPSDPETLWRVEMVESFIVDLLKFFCYLLYHSDRHMELLLEAQPFKLQKLQEYFGDNKWILGSELSYLDFLLYEVLYQHTVVKSDILQDYPRLTQHLKNFEDIPEIETYMQSPEFIVKPLYTPVARNWI